MLEFTHVFLDAFWWWGNYIHFDFCDQLVTDLGHLAKQWAGSVNGSGRPVVDEDDEDAWPEIGALHQALQRILRGYPLRTVKSKDADWDDVRKALLTVQRPCGLQARDARQLTTVERHVAALLLVYLAHTWRYQAPMQPEAHEYYIKTDRYYSRAEERFAQEKDWSEAWIAFERADSCIERRDLHAIPDLWRRAAGIVQPQEVEPEVNTSRTRNW